MNIILSGPCGVGKSTIGKVLAKRIRVKYLDFDELGFVDMERRSFGISPFSIAGFNLPQCFSIMLNNPTDRFVLDIGGENVFRQNTDNKNRVDQINTVKIEYSSLVFVLSANKLVLINRYLREKERDDSEFNRIWFDWKNIAEPCWNQCGDVFIDTTCLDVIDVVDNIVTHIKYKE